MRRLIAMMMVLVATACSTPVGDDWSKYVAAVGGLSASARSTLVRYAMNRKALEFLSKYPHDYEIGQVYCDELKTGKRHTYTTFTAEFMWQCLGSPLVIYENCLDVMADKFANLINKTIEELGDRDEFHCWSVLKPEFVRGVAPENLFDPAAWDDDEDLARAILEFPVPPGAPSRSTGAAEIAAAIAELVQAIRVIAPALCALDAEHWACGPDWAQPPQGDR